MDYSTVDSRILHAYSLRMNYILCKDKINTVQYKFLLLHTLFMNLFPLLFLSYNGCSKRISSLSLDQIIDPIGCWFSYRDCHDFVEECVTLLDDEVRTICLIWVQTKYIDRRFSILTTAHLVCSPTKTCGKELLPQDVSISSAEPESDKT